MAQHDQSTYQVRFDWAIQGLARLGPADVVVVVDVLSFSTTAILALENGDNQALDAAAHVISPLSVAVCEAAAHTGALVVLGGLRNADAVAAALHAEQARRAQRTSIAVIASGELDKGTPDAGLRFAVEDQLGAGAIVEALGRRGIDHTSPEAAVAGESFRALRRASAHLLTASAAGRELIDAGRRDEVLAAAQVDAASVVPVLREGTFLAL